MTNDAYNYKAYFIPLPDNSQFNDKEDKQF